MALNVNGIDIRKAEVNGSEIKKIYCNGAKIWSKPGVEYVGGANFNQNASVNSTFNFSIPIQAGDLILVTTSTGWHTTASTATPSGYTTLATSYASASNTNIFLRVSYKVATGGESSIYVPGSVGGNGVNVRVYRNVDTSNILDVGITAETATHIYNNNVNPAPIDPLNDGAMIVCAGTAWTIDANPSISASYLSGFGYGKGFYYISYDGGQYAAYGSITGTGHIISENGDYYDPAAWGYSGSTSGATHTSVTIALRPA